MDTIWTALGNTPTKFGLNASWFTYGVTSIWFAIFASWNIAVLGNQWIVYAGALLYLFSTWCIAAYLALKVIEAAVGALDGAVYYFAAEYRDHSWLGNGLGLWEVFWAMWFLWWSFGLSAEAYWNTSNLIDEMFKREHAVYHEGSMGSSVDTIEAIQHFVLLMVLTVVTWIVGCSLGDSMDELVNWFNQYGDNTDDEAQGNQSSRDAAGTAIYYDLGYHTVLIVGVDFLYGVMMLGAGWFYAYSGFADFKPVKNCDLNEVDSSRYNGLVSDIESISLKSYTECQDIFKNIAKQMDIDGNNYVDRCEDAKFLKGIGNTDEYSLTYSTSRSLPQVLQLCDYLVIDAFDQPKEEDKDFMQLLLELIAGEFPTTLLNKDGKQLFNLNMRPMSLK